MMEGCPACDRDLWHVGHVCYTYADLRRWRSQAQHTQPELPLEWPR